jgi:hypothetical protein
MNSIRDDHIVYTEDGDLQVKGVTTIVDYLQYSVIEELKENEDYSKILNESRKVGKKKSVVSVKRNMQTYGRKIYPCYG